MRFEEFGAQAERTVSGSQDHHDRLPVETSLGQKLSRCRFRDQPGRIPSFKRERKLEIRRHLHHGLCLDPVKPALDILDHHERAAAFKRQHTTNPHPRATVPTHLETGIRTVA